MKTINERLTVAPQTAPGDFQALYEAGYRTVINNRPDDETGDQPSAGACAAKARAAGLRYYHVPTPTDRLDPAAVDGMQRAVAEADGPIFAHCRSGQRSLLLWLACQVREGTMAPGEATAMATDYGFAPAALEAWLKRAGNASTASPQVEGFYDPRTFSIQYIVTDPATSRCAIIDPVLDYDEKSGATATHNADALLAHVRARGLSVDWILDTHPHADHFSAAQYLHTQTGAPTAIGEHVVEVQALWKDLYGLGDEVPGDGSQWHRLFAAGDTFSIGDMQGEVLFSPGHTLASVTYVIGDAAFVHDTLFTPDFGTARADFPGGSATSLWRSINDILALPDTTRVFVGHDYQPNGREPRWETSVAEQRQTNPHVCEPMDETRFVAMREARDRTLPMPKLILHALQVNIRGGRLPEPAANGRRYLRIPLDTLSGADWGDSE